MSTICCKRCHHACFFQKEIRKTKVAIIQGEAIRHGPPDEPIIVYYCSRCGSGLPMELAKKIRFKSQFTSVLLN
jgi:hypothetical protein